MQNQCWFSINTILFLSLPEVLHLLRQVVAHKLVEFMEVDLSSEGQPLHLIHVSTMWEKPMNDLETRDF